MGNKRSTVKLINIHLYIMTNLGGSRHGEKQSCVHQCQERQLDFHVKHKHTPAAFLLYCMCTTHKSQTETLPSLSLSLSSTHFSRLTGAEKCPLPWTHLQFSALTPASLFLPPSLPPFSLPQDGFQLRSTLATHLFNSFFSGHLLFSLYFWS